MSMKVLIVEFHILSAHVQAFQDAIVTNARASLASESGCRQFDVCLDASDPTRFMLYELYDDDAAVQAHLQSAHFLQMNASTAEWVSAKTVWCCERIAP